MLYNLGTTTITYTNGTVTAKVQVEFREDGVYARFNDGESVFRPVDSNSAIFINAYLPLQPIHSTLDTETARTYAGKWSAQVDPPVYRELDDEIVLTTPQIDFEVRSLIFEDVEFEPSPPNEDGVSVGGSFSGRAQLLGSGSTQPPEEGDLAWGVEIVDVKSGRGVYRGHGFSPGAPSNTLVSGTWDGRINLEPPSEDPRYTANMWAVVETDSNPSDPAANSGQVATPRRFGPIDLSEPEIEITPNPYLPFNEEGLNIWYDDDGVPQWPDDDGNGEPDLFPDFDNDGVPDWQPGEKDQSIRFYSYIGRGGYDVSSWELKVSTDDGEVLFEESGSGPEVEVEWPNPPQGLDPQTLDVTISFQRCFKDTVDTAYHPQFEWRPRSAEIRTQGGGDATPIGCAMISAEGELAYGTMVPKLEIKEGRQVLATSKDDPADLTEAGVSRLGRIQELRTWEVRLSGLEVDGQPPNTVNLTIDSSGSKDDIELRHIESGVEGEVYQTFVISTDPILLNQPDQSYVYNEIEGYQDKPDGLAEVDEGDLSDFSTAIENIALALKAPNYPYANRPKRLGILEYLTSAEPRVEPDKSPRSIGPGRAIGDRRNFPKFGFEDVTFSFEDANSQFSNTTKELKTTVKAQNKASFVYTLVHGGPDGGIQLPRIGNNGAWTYEDFLPSSLREDEVAGLKTLILDSCAALATNDYNNEIVNSSTPLSGRPKGGFEWRKHTRVSGTGPVLLGYNKTIWRQTAQKSRTNYFPELSRLKGEGVDDSLVQQYAWLSANRKNGGQGHFACAVDDDFYYYMSYDTGPNRDSVYGQLEVKFVKVPINSIDSVQVDSFNQYNNGVPNGALEFFIPGVE